MLVRRIQQQLVTPALTKDDRSPVTIADFAAQALVAELLARRFDGARLVGEEDAGQLREEASAPALEQITRFLAGHLDGATSDRVCELIDQGAGDPGAHFWTLDPIDGTKGFLRGDQYAVALAEVRNGQVQVGALACPELVGASRAETGGAGSVLVAVRGKGTWTGPLEESPDSPLAVSDRSDPAHARLLRSVESGHTNTDTIDAFVSALCAAAPPVALDSQAKYAVLAAGVGDIMVRFLSASRPDYREKIWDHAAGSLIVEEAGGRVSDLAGRPLDFSQGRALKNNRGILATNRHLHDAALDAISRIGA